jgi:hypothetical protein
MANKGGGSEDLASKGGGRRCRSSWPYDLSQFEPGEYHEQVGA